MVKLEVAMVNPKCCDSLFTSFTRMEVGLLNIISQLLVFLFTVFYSFSFSKCRLQISSIICRLDIISSETPSLGTYSWKLLA